MSPRSMVARLHVDLDGRRYNVQYQGEMVVVGSADPEFDLARTLVARGLSGSVKILDARTGKHRSTLTNIEKAARLCTKEGPLRFAPYQSRPDCAPAGETALLDIPSGELETQS